MLEELQFGIPILTSLLFLPLAGALLIWAFQDEDAIKHVALGCSLLELVLVIVVLVKFVPESAAM